MRSLLRACAVSCGAFLLAAGGEAEADVTFKGKTIEVLLGSAPGGGTDGTTRLVGTFLEKYLPGNPTMRYRNVPGGHGAKALNYFTKVKPDGLTWAGGGSSHVDPNSLRMIVFTDWQYGHRTATRRRSGTRSSDSNRSGAAIPYASSFAFASSDIQSVVHAGE